MTPFAGGPASWSELGVRCQLGLEESSMSSMGGDDVGSRLKALSICCGATANQRCYVASGRQKNCQNSHWPRIGVLYVILVVRGQCG